MGTHMHPPGPGHFYLFNFVNRQRIMGRYGVGAGVGDVGDSDGDFVGDVGDFVGAAVAVTHMQTTYFILLQPVAPKLDIQLESVADEDPVFAFATEVVHSAQFELTTPPLNEPDHH